jgi:hypothetical protein
MKKIKMMMIAMVAIFIVAGNSAYASFPVKSEKKQIETTQVVPATNNPDETPVTVVNKEKSAKPDEVTNANKTMGNGSGFAIAGFIASILGLFILPIVFLPLGIVFSALGLKSDLRGLAIAGLIIGIIGILLLLILILLFAAALSGGAI